MGKRFNRSGNNRSTPVPPPPPTELPPVVPEKSVIAVKNKKKRDSKKESLKKESQIIPESSIPQDEELPRLNPLILGVLPPTPPKGSSFIFLPTFAYPILGIDSSEEK